MLLFYFNTPPLVVKRALRQMGIPEDELDEQAQAIIEAQCMSLANRARSSHKPVVVYTYRDMMERGNRVLMEQGIPVYPSGQNGRPRPCGPYPNMASFGKQQGQLIVLS